MRVLAVWQMEKMVQEEFVAKIKQIKGARSLRNNFASCGQSNQNFCVHFPLLARSRAGFIDYRWVPTDKGAVSICVCSNQAAIDEFTKVQITCDAGC